MHRIASTLIVVLSLAGALTWACRSSSGAQAYQRSGVSRQTPARVRIAATGSDPAPWTATVSAPASCAASLPPGTAHRVYGVSVVRPFSPAPLLTLSSAFTMSPNTFAGSLSAGTLTVPLPDEIDYGQNDGGILERLAPGRWLDVSGTITAPIASPPATGVLDGAFDYYEVDPMLKTLPGLAEPRIHCAGRGTVVLARTSPDVTARRP